MSNVRVAWGNREIFFPKLSEHLHLITFSDIAERYLRQMGYEPFLCSSEDEARDCADDLIAKKKWPCYFFKSDTTAEKILKNSLQIKRILI